MTKIIILGNSENSQTMLLISHKHVSSDKDLAKTEITFTRLHFKCHEMLFQQKVFAKNQWREKYVNKLQ